MREDLPDLRRPSKRMFCRSSLAGARVEARLLGPATGLAAVAARAADERAVGMIALRRNSDSERARARTRCAMRMFRREEMRGSGEEVLRW